MHICKQTCCSVDLDARDYWGATLAGEHDLGTRTDRLLDQDPLLAADWLLLVGLRVHERACGEAKRMHDMVVRYERTAGPW